ncbi:MAG TPA: Tim44-like domain-containing protein [Clostridiaceae bacterium]|nr:Tim44-like domain-containing protein [Clostridiaceae bacterium]
MKKSNGFRKAIKIITVILIIFATSFVFCELEDKSNADAGYHSSYSGGKSSSSSKSSSSKSSSSKSSSSKSRSSSSSSKSRSSSSSSNSSSGETVSLGESFLALLVIGVMYIFVPAIIIIVVIALSKNKKLKNNNRIVVTNNEQAINEIKKYIPSFDANKFLLNGYGIFVRIEEAWMNFDLEKVRDCITDEMFNMYESQLTSMEMNGEQNIMKDFKLINSAVTQASKQNNMLQVKTRYTVEFYDYIINRSTKAIVRGNSNRKMRMVYEFTFIKDIENKKLDKCPNCGAEININSAGICKYCNSKLVDDSKDWVMSKKVSLLQQ